MIPKSLERETLQRMIDVLRHRGPDGEGTYWSSQGSGFRREGRGTGRWAGRSSVPPNSTQSVGEAASPRDRGNE